MKSKDKPRLDRAKIIDTGLRLALATAPDGPVAVTGATLGRALKVDRSAVWRHFSDRADLYTALQNDMLEPVVADAIAVEEPWDRLVAVFHGIVDAYRLRPLLAFDTVGLSPSGSNWQRLAEVIISALGELGLTPERSAGYFRMFIEIGQSYAASLASYEMRPAEDRARELDDIRRELRSIDVDLYPHLHATGRFLEQLRQREVTDLIIQTLRLALEDGRVTEAHPRPAAHGENPATERQEQR